MQDKNQFKDNQLETRYNFANQVRTLREGLGLSITEMSAKSGMMKRHIRQMELGKLESIGAIFDIARFFDKKVKIEFY